MAYDDICMLTHMQLCWSGTRPTGQEGTNFDHGDLCKATMTYANCASVTASDGRCS